jgi:hypothetical protein
MLASEKGRFVAWTGHREDGLWEAPTSILMGKPKRKKPLGILRRRLEANIKIDLGEVWGGLVCLMIGTS